MAHEHMAIAVIRTYMGTLINTFRPAPSAPRALAATPIHQLHELGALAAALGAAAEGWQVTYLGPNVPAEELAKAAELAGSSAVLLSVLLPENDTQLESEIMTLRKLLPDGIKIMIGGHICGRFVEAMSKENIDFRTDPAQLRIGLRDLAESLR
jgi:methanogenic corrinoid protein MtbC1